MSKTAELHKLEGTFRGDRHSDDVKAPMIVRMPKPPEGMSDAAAAWWKKKCIDLKEMGMLYRSDLEALATYCNMLAQLDFYQEKFDSALDAEVKHKWMKRYNDAWKVCSQLNSALGQNALARTKIKIEKPEEGTELDDI